MNSLSSFPSRRALLAGAGIALAGGLFCLLPGCSESGGSAAIGSGEEPASGGTFAFDTYCTFSVYGDDAALSKLTQACAHYDKLFNLYSSDSDIARINAAKGAAVEVDPATADLISQALAYCAEFDGLFDITIGAVSTLWDFDEGVRPSDEAISDALPHVGWRGVHVDEDACTVQLDDPQAQLDLGGIAKGYVADRLVELLETETSATAAMISLGGNIALFGTKPDGEPWLVGVRDPNDPGGSTVVGTASLAEPTSLVTSGLYERTFEQDGVTYWHILDPNTGMPVSTDVDSVTVACPSSTLADTLSTTLFVAGSDRGRKIADERDDVAAYFILHDGATVESSRWDAITSFTS